MISLKSNLNFFSDGDNDHLSMILSISNIFEVLALLIWGLGQLPQLIRFYTSELIQGVSFIFLLFRFIGDLLYLINSIIIDLPVNNQAIISYFCFIDAVLVLQYWYYLDKSSISNVESNNWWGLWGLGFLSSINGLYIKQQPHQFAIHSRQQLHLLENSSKFHPCDFQSNFPFSSFTIWLAVILFILARIFQIFLNFQLKSVNLSLKFILLYLFGTICYLISLILDLYLKMFNDVSSNFSESIWDYLPYLLGAIGTIIGDSIILYQYYLYKSSDLALSPTHSYDFNTTWPSYSVDHQEYTDPKNQSGNSLTSNSRFLHTMQHENPKSNYKPAPESEYLLKNSLYTIPPPKHYVSSYGTNSYTNAKLKPNTNINNSTPNNVVGLNGINSYKSFGFLLFNRSTNNSFKNPDGSYLASKNSHLSTSLLPSIIGNYSKVSRKMSQDTKIPFSPIDFLSDQLENDDISERFLNKSSL